jgi:hypothetical protein
MSRQFEEMRPAMLQQASHSSRALEYLNGLLLLPVDPASW